MQRSTTHALVCLSMSMLLVGGIAQQAAVAVPPVGQALPAPDATDDCVDLEGPPPAWAGRLTQPRDTVVRKTEHWIARPDGTLLEVTAYLPAAFAGPRPAILHYTPYSSQGSQAVGWEEAEGSPAYPVLSETLDPFAGFEIRHCSGYFHHWTPFFLRRGYAYVTADIRGTGDSTGCYDAAGPAEQADGRAIVDWIADQPWSDGTVGMHGFSLDGLSQLATAITAPPALKAIVPVSASDIYSGMRPGGAPIDDVIAFSSLPWLSRAGSACSPETMTHLYGPDGHLDAWWNARWMPLHAKKIEAAVLYPVGTPRDTIYGFGPMWRALERARVPAKAIVGPWSHGYPSVDGWELHELRWFEHHLRGVDTGVMREPRVVLLDRDGSVQTRSTFDVRLTALMPSAGALIRKPDDGAATYTDRPGSPRSVIEADPTAHVRYLSAPLDGSASLSGIPRLDLLATVDRDDTNFIAMLYAVAPGGTRRYLTRGFLDARLRNGSARPPEPVPPGLPQRYPIDFWPLHTTVAAGSRIELVLSSSDSCYDCPWPDAPEDYFPWPIRSDAPAATVSVLEGKAATRLLLPLG
jgi:X-Pro dipeptidyl-peptidase